MSGEGSFSTLDAADLLKFAKQEARSVLGAEGNKWLRLVDVASAGMRRSPIREERASYAETAIIALDGLRACTRMPDEDWAPRAIRVRVNWTLLSDQSDAGKRAQASAAFEIFAERLSAVELDSSFASQRSLGLDRENDEEDRIRRLASQLSRISQYLTTGQNEAINVWLGPGGQPRSQ